MESLNLFFVANFYLCPIGFSVKTIIVPDGDGKEFYFFFSIQEGLRVWKAGPDQHPVCISELDSCLASCVEHFSPPSVMQNVNFCPLPASSSRFQQTHCLTTLCFRSMEMLVVVVIMMVSYWLVLVSYLIWFFAFQILFFITMYLHQRVISKCKFTELS